MARRCCSAVVCSTCSAQVGTWQRRGFPQWHGVFLVIGGRQLFFRDEAAQRFGYRFRGVLSSAGVDGVSALQDLRKCFHALWTSRGFAWGNSGESTPDCSCGDRIFVVYGNEEAQLGWCRCHVGSFQRRQE